MAGAEYRNAKQVLKDLAKPGPHDVLRGDLALVGLPGAVYSPAAGRGLPAVVFGHGWLQPPQRYRGLLRHLASWGVVTVVPGTHLGPLASHRLYAADLAIALDVCTGVRLGDGRITVDPAKLGLGGHSFGGGAAVLAAAQESSRVRAVATLAASEAKPSAVLAAQSCRMPGLHITAGEDVIAPSVANAERIARAWAGPVQLRSLPKASHLGFTEGRHWSQLLLAGKAERRTHRLARALLTAFFLKELTGTRAYDLLVGHDVRGTVIEHELAGRPA